MVVHHCWRLGDDLWSARGHFGCNEVDWVMRERVVQCHSAAETIACSEAREHGSARIPVGFARPLMRGVDRNRAVIQIRLGLCTPQRAGDQGLENAKGAGCAEGLLIVEEVPVVESEAIVDVKSGPTTACSLPKRTP